MQCHRLVSLSLVSVALVFLLFLTACGSSSSSSQSNPMFTSTPVTAATQGVVYTYTLAATDPSGAAVTFSLTTAPTGATLSGNTLTWTPTAAQSRTPNSFTVTASASGGSASQSWTVSPAGTVTVSWINDYWEPGGPIPYPVSPSASLGVNAVVPQADGSIVVLLGSTVSPGTITIDAVPAGNYWLTFGITPPPNQFTSAIWTNTSHFDAGRWIAGFIPNTTTSSTTTFQFALSGLDSIPTSSVYFDPAIPGALFGVFLDSNSTTLDANLIITGPTDWTVTKQQFLAQYEPSTFGPWSTLNLGTSAMTPLTFVNGATNPITVTLSPSAAASPIDVNVKGTQWAALFDNAAPTPSVTPTASGLTISVEPFVTRQGVYTLSAENLLLVGTPTRGSQTVFFFPDPTGCDPAGFFPIPESVQPAITTDQDLGMLTYGDPFFSPTSSLVHTETFCEEAQVQVPIPGSNTPALYTLVDSATVPPSSSAIVPVVSQIQSPMINGGSLFTAATLSSTTPMLSWTAPATGSPFAYRVFAYVLKTVKTMQLYVNAGTFTTSQTSVTLPPLSGGNTYVFAVSALVDSGANEQNQPYRSVIPVGSATVISAPFTIPAGAATPRIHGDAGVVKRLSQPQPPASAR